MVYIIKGRVFAEGRKAGKEDMANTMVRVSPRTHDILRELATKAGEPMQAILDHAVEEYRRRLFLEETNTAYAALRAHPEAWAQEREERELWDKAILDGIEDE